MVIIRYKELWGDQGSQSDIVKDIAAMANSGGGVIVYGVTEEQKCASDRVDAGEVTEEAAAAEGEEEAEGGEEEAAEAEAESE